MTKQGLKDYTFKLVQEEFPYAFHTTHQHLIFRLERKGYKFSHNLRWFFSLSLSLLPQGVHIMLLSTISLLLLITCVFGFKQSRDLKRAKDLTNKQGLELTLIRSQYKHNITRLLQLEKDKEELTLEISGLLKEIQELNSELRSAQESQLDIEKFQDTIESHVLNVLSSIDLQEAYEAACHYHALELSIKDLVKWAL